MNKDLYKSIRQKDNFLFMYYLEMGGYIKNERRFKKHLSTWLLLKKGLNLQQGSIFIIKYLDQKHQYER